MKPNSNSKRILLIDHQSYWRKISTDALKKFGFAVDACETYNYLPSQECVEDKNHDLIVLGCSCIGTEEQQLIDDALAGKHHLLVLCTSLSWQTMRMLFLQGVDDIVDKPYNPANLVKIVNQVLERIPPAIAIKQ
jgi:DNA-binding response OmpR family regulator